MRTFLNWFRQEESGQGMVEYALIIALVSIVAIALLITMGDKIKGVFQKSNDALTSAGAITVTTQVAQND